MLDGKMASGTDGMHKYRVIGGYIIGVYYHIT
jgi:hypothetical protein